MPKNWKQWFEGSPAVLVIGAIAASATFLLDVGEKVWRLRKEITAPEPPRASIRIEKQNPALAVPPSWELLKIPAVRGRVEKQAAFVKLFSGKAPTDTSTTHAPPQLVVRPLRVLVLNPTKERLTVHTCRGVVNRPDSLFLSHSIGYFLGQDIAKVRADEFEPLISVDPGDALRIEALFIFAYVPSLQEFDLKEEIKKGTGLAAFELQCEDQAARILRTTAVGVPEVPKPAAPKPYK